ncbi:nucleoside phosphorylase domain-containing protein [Podospora australis]|uniref:Nucleoside phosphorylase domain-containing protein n=1 Tax=Podospora australis TaxID=1536484 RepID=A0AAN6WRG4_9PEZI|nr:nucleoside phosphorylase domain-containing protein [Podospora australis]
MAAKRLTADAYTVALIYAKPLELHAISVMLDEHHESVPLHHSHTNEYKLGRIGNHNVAIAGPSRGAQGKAAIATVVSQIRFAFPNISVGLLVGIGGGVPRLPEHDVRLGDVVIGAPEVGPAVVQYDFGKQLEDTIEVTRTLNKPPELLLKVVNILDDKYHTTEEGAEDFFARHLRRFAKFPKLKHRFKRPEMRDRLFQADYNHELGSLCSSHGICYEIERPDRPPDDILIHYSTILSGDLVMKSATRRDELSTKHNNALCFEMEAAGLMDVFPCLVIRGICDYSDSHKTKEWQEYAAAVAGAYARELLLNMAERIESQLHAAASQEPEAIKSLPLRLDDHHNIGGQVPANIHNLPRSTA